MTEMHARIPEPDSCQRSSEEHFALRFVVLRIPHCSRQVLDGAAQGLQGEDITDGVRALVRGAVDGVLRARSSLIVGDGGPTLEAVAQDVEAGARVHGGGHGAGVQGVADAESGLEGAVGDAGLGARRGQVEDRRAGRFGAGASGGGDGDEGLEGLVDREALAEGCVDEVEEIGVGVAGVEVHEFGCVDDRAAADGEEGVGLVGFGEGNGLFDAVYG